MLSRDYPEHLLRAADMPESGMLAVDDRDDCLRVTALEMAVKHCPNGGPDDVVQAAEKFRTFLAGPADTVPAATVTMEDEGVWVGSDPETVARHLHGTTARPWDI